MTELIVFDGLFGNFILGEVMLVGGRPLSGRTLLARQMAYEAGVERRIPTLLTATDETEFTVRGLLETVAFELAGLEPSVREVVRLAERNRITRSRLDIDDRTHTPESLLESCERHVAERGTQLVIIADVANVVIPGATTQAEYGLGLTEIVKRIARELRIGVLVTASLRRYGLPYPTAKDLRWPSLLEVADRTILLHRPGVEERRDPAEPRVNVYLPGVYEAPRARLWCDWRRRLVTGVIAESPF